MELEINCTTDKTVSIKDLGFFAKDIKVRNMYDIKRMKESIRKSGFICPLFIWNNNGVDTVLDGKTRVLALLELSKEGYEIGGIPVVQVEAENEAEAKEKVLQINSRYGKITEASFDFFVKDANLNKADFNIRFDKVDFGAVDTYREEQKKAKEDVLRVISEGKPINAETPVKTGLESPVTHSFTQGGESCQPSEMSASETSLEPVMENEEEWDFSEGGEEQTVAITCPYCYEDFELTLDECLDLLRQVQYVGKGL